METILQAIQAKIAEPNNFKDSSYNEYKFNFVDEDSGQLEAIPNPPVKWPCALIDISTGNFSSNGNDRFAEPITRQQGTLQIEITVADLKISNSSSSAPVFQKNKAFKIWKYVEALHKKMQGFKPSEKSGALVRSGFKKIRRDDGIQEVRVTYTLGISNC